MKRSMLFTCLISLFFITSSIGQSFFEKDGSALNFDLKSPKSELRDNPVDNIVSNLDKYALDLSPEKIYLQTDRSLYALEDTVWFKAYALDGIQHVPTTTAKIIYISVFDSKGDKVIDKKLYAEEKGAASDFFIGRDWKPGRYKIRAYTNYMLNQDQSYIHEKDIEIVDVKQAYEEIFATSDAETYTTATSYSELDVRFFPESGDLIAGIDSKVAIKIENYVADPEGLSGAIEDKLGQLISSFKIYERGYGVASFTPVQGEKYFAKFDNDSKLYALPDVQAEGYSISKLHKKNNVSFLISSNTDTGLSDGDVIIHSKGQLIYHVELDDDKIDSYALKLDTKELPNGVSSITFFDNQGIPRCERLFFINNEVAETSIATGKKMYGKREQVDVDFVINNTEAIAYDCSVAVYDKSSTQGSRPSDNIKSWMLLNSDLRGEVYDPGYYFEKSGDFQRSYLLDLVMMTHGWRRFDWSDLSQKEGLNDVQYEREMGLYVKGYVRKTLNKKATVKSTVVLTSLGQYFSQEEITTEEDGRFAFGPYIIADSMNVIVQARKYSPKKGTDILEEGNRRVRIDIDKPQYVELDRPIFNDGGEFDYEAYKSYVDKNRNAQAIKDQYHSMEVRLSEVVLTSKRKTKDDEMDAIVEERSVYTEPTHRLILDDRDRIGYASVFDLLRQVSGVLVTGTFPNQSVTIRGVSTLNASSTPFYLLDGLPVDEATIQLVHPNEVLFIDVLVGARAAIFGARANTGAIAIYTGRDPNSDSAEGKPGIIDVIVQGFNKNRQFYSPDYSKDVSDVYEPDVRATLYWNPYVSLTASEVTTLDFHTGDNTGTYQILVEGIGEDGSLVYFTKDIIVQ